MLLTGSLTGQVPIAVNTAFSVGEAGPPATGNVLSAVPVIRSYDFDLNGNDGASPDGWVDTLGTSAPGNLILPDNARVEGGRGTGGFFNAVGDQDAAHPSLVMSSPPFQLQTDLSISFQITSGQGTANVPANLAAVPADSTTTGFQGLALRRVATGDYVLSARRAGNGNGCQNGSFSIADLANASATYPGETFVLDWIDCFHGGWGFAMVDIRIDTITASSDLITWGAPIATGVTAASTPYVEDNIAAANAKRFYVLVPAGAPYPASQPAN